MKRLLAALLAVMLVCSMSFPAFAAEEEKENNVTVKYVTTVEGAYVAKVQNGDASISADGVSVSVTGAPSNAKTLVVIPMTGDALSWIDSCVDGDTKAAYDIHFEDAEDNRIGANGVSVSVTASGTELKDGQTVWLVCSSGPMIEKVEMPKLVGMSYAAAKAELELMGFAGDISYVRRESNEPRDEVIEQPYAKGELVDITEDIVLTVSKGPKETEPPAEKPTEKEQETSQKQQTTKTVSIDLPTDKEEDYTVGLYLDGKAVLDTALVSAGTPSIDVTLTGSGTVYYDLYINGSYYKTVKVEFS